MFAMSKRTKLGFAAILAAMIPLMFTQRAAAQEWPQRTVKIISPSGPGSSGDTAARFIAERLQQVWGKSIVIEPRPGGDSLVAINAFVSANDDHTLLFSPTSFFISHPHRYAKLSYDRERDLIAVAQLSATTLAFAVPASLPVNSIAEFVAYGRANPGKVSVATAPGMSEMMLDAFLKEAGLDAAKVPYRDVVQAANDVALGRLQGVFAALTIFQAGLQANTVKVLSVSGQQQSPAAPGVKTAIEQGFPRLGQEGLMGLFAPRTMAADARKKLADDFLKVAAEPDIIKRLGTIGQFYNPGDAQRLEAEIRKQIAAIAEMAKALGIEPK